MVAVGGFAGSWLARGHQASSEQIVANGPTEFLQAEEEQQTVYTCDEAFQPVRQEVRGPSPFVQQATNEDVFDQTIFNRHFESGTDKLTADGLRKLDSMTRRRSGPELKLYLQMARDVAYDSAAPEKLAAGRRELNAKRATSIEKYLIASNTGRFVSFDVTLIEFLSE